MIQRIHIKNYALIDALDIRFPKGLTIITGETGAGKSIILGALGLIMGDRADTKALYNPDEKCVIEGYFSVKEYQLKDFFRDNDLDYEDELIIRREITPSGKSRAFINDTPASIKVLQELSAVLVDLHQQFDTLDIHQMGFQMRLLDALSANQERLQTYQRHYRQYTADRQQLHRLQSQQSTANKELDFMRFQWDELQEAQLQADEQEAWEEEFAALANAEDTRRVVADAFQYLCESEQAIVSQLHTLGQSLAASARVDSTVNKLYERLLGTLEELTDIGNALENHADRVESNPERLQELQSRLDLIYKLQKKHNVASVQELLAIQDSLGQALGGYENADEEIARLTRQVSEAAQVLRQQAQELSTHRKRVAPEFARQVGATLAELAMPAAQLLVDFQPTEDLTPTGSDEVQFLFTANKGSAPKPIKQVASGGELSRLTLVTKSIVANAMALPTLIFDEIDAGVSGDVALKMGYILRNLSQHHQVVVITHSPQVAARAEEHLFVYKKEDDNRTTTRVRVLQPEERIRAIATMLSQSPPSASALENARELVQG
ncbi:MAG: DNA repair protein RecN [Saprospiraceae bacterium]